MKFFYALADESDLQAFETVLVERFAAFVERWQVPGAELVNRKARRLPDQVRPDWSIGLGIDEPSIGPTEVKILLDFLADLSNELPLSFLVGIASPDWDPVHRNLCLVKKLVPVSAVQSVIEGVRAV